MRVTQRSMYTNFVGNMNKNLSDYMESSIQGSSQKRLNRPSDDPVGMARVLSYRASIERNSQYESNSKDAEAWLASTDSALTQANILLTSIKEKVGQIATGTVTSANREQVSSQLRQMLGQLINLANTEYNGQHLFSGTKTNLPSYQQGLGITATGDEANAINGAAWVVTGDTDKTAMIRFPDDGNIPPAVGDSLDYEYSKDGGKTWQTKTLTAGQRELDLDGVTVSLPASANGDPNQTVHVTAYDPSKDTLDDDGNITNISCNNGSVLFVRPAVFYQGDDNDLPPQIDIYGNNAAVNSTVSSGKFSSDVRIRLDEDAVVGTNGKVAYSYSMDNGVTWVDAMADTRVGENKIRLQVPGGYLDVTPQTGATLTEGQQFVIRPRRADLGLEISQGEFISATNSGKDIFGGQYAGVGQDVPVPTKTNSTNIFEVVSNLIAWAENGIQSGCQEELTNLKSAQEDLLTSIARVGGQVNRVSLNVTMLETHRDDQTSRMSAIEDVDLTELITRLSQQQMAYQTVLQSSSMIMKLNLTNYL